MMMQVQPRRRRLSSMKDSVLRVERARGLVEDEDRGLADQGAGDLQALALAAGEVAAALLEHRVVAALALSMTSCEGGVAAGGGHARRAAASRPTW